jgi:hypothetical protein
MEGTIWKRLGKKISMSEVHLKESSIVRVVSFFAFGLILNQKCNEGLKLILPNALASTETTL